MGGGQGGAGMVFVKRRLGEYVKVEFSQNTPKSL